MTEGGNAGKERNMKKTVLLFPVAAALAVYSLSLLTFSCGSLKGGIRAPSVSLHSVDTIAIGPRGVDLVCRLNVENHNAVDIPFPEIDWELFINASSFLAERIENQEPITGQGLTVVNIPVSLNYGDILSTFKSFKAGQDVKYTIALETRFLLPMLGELVWNFEHEGKISLIRMISFHNPSVKIEKLDFNGADLVCSMEIDNPNVFPIPFPKIHYNYEVRNTNFITGTTAFPGSLAPGGRTRAEIRLRVVFSDLYLNIPSLKTVGEAASLFSLSSSVSLPGFEGEELNLEIPGTLPLLKPPVLSFRGISVKNIGLSRIDFEFGWDLENPNDFVFEADNFEYRFLVNNNSWTQGKPVSKVRIAAGGKVSVPISISIRTPALVKDLTDIITRGMYVTYDLSGTVDYGSDLRSFSGSSLPFKLSGRTKLRR
jgi:LEA14-like dessication related protein